MGPKDSSVHFSAPCFSAKDFATASAPEYGQKNGGQKNERSHDAHTRLARAWASMNLVGSAFHRVPRFSLNPTPTSTRSKEDPNAPGPPASRFWGNGCAQGKSRTRWNASLPEHARFMRSFHVPCPCSEPMNCSSRREEALTGSNEIEPPDVGCYPVHGKPPFAFAHASGP